MKRQLGLYHRRITLMWGASALLSVALLAFVGTVLSVILSARETRLSVLGVVPLLAGLSPHGRCHRAGAVRDWTGPADRSRRACRHFRGPRDAGRSLEPESLRPAGIGVNHGKSWTESQITSQIERGGQTWRKNRRELAGLAVVTLAGGEKLGKIDDIVFNPATGLITGFFVDRGAIFSKPKFLPTGDVQSIGEDALTTESEAGLLDGPSAPTGELAAKTVENLPVLNPEGTVLGKVADISVDNSKLHCPTSCAVRQPPCQCPARQAAPADLGGADHRRRQRYRFQLL